MPNFGRFPSYGSPEPLQRLGNRHNRNWMVGNMTMLIVGQCTGLAARTAGNENSERGTWQEHHIVVLSGMYTLRVKVPNVDKFKGTLPQAGEMVAIECGIETWISRDDLDAFRKDTSQRPRISYGYVGFARNAEVERAFASVSV